MVSWHCTEKQCSDHWHYMIMHGQVVSMDTALVLSTVPLLVCNGKLDIPGSIHREQTSTFIGVYNIIFKSPSPFKNLF